MADEEQDGEDIVSNVEEEILDDDDDGPGGPLHGKYEKKDKDGTYTRDDHYSKY
jgi:hypothetical protein